MEGIIVRTPEEAQTICQKYISFIPDKWYEALEDMVLGLKNTLFIPKAEIDVWEQERTQRKALDEKLNRAAMRNNQGIILEKEGRIKEALALYEENLVDGYPATHSFERLMILYRKRKEYDQELRVINRALEVFGQTHDLRWVNRRDKVLNLINAIK